MINNLKAGYKNFRKTLSCNAYLGGGLNAFIKVVASLNPDDDLEFQASLYFATRHFGLEVQDIAKLSGYSRMYINGMRRGDHLHHARSYVRQAIIDAMLALLAAQQTHPPEGL